MMTGRRYQDSESTPVPFPSCRCDATKTEQRAVAHSSLTHHCKATDRHKGAHRCICGLTWPRPAKAAA